MAKLPNPPSPITAPAATTTFRAGSVLWRLYSAGGAHPGAWDAFRYFGPTNARFDHHLLPKSVQARGILYAADELTTCIAEVFQATRVIDRSANAPWLVGFEIVRDVVLLDLTGAWPTLAGASMAINSGPRPKARAWSQEIYAAYPTVEGLLYGSSMHANKRAFALYERAHSALAPSPVFHRALGDPALRSRLIAAATTLGYRLV
jgi:hypothetical protein